MVAGVRLLADWDNIDLASPPDVAAEISAMVDEMNDGGDLLAEFPKVPPYMGDDAFRVFLEKHDCSASMEHVRLRFLGAAVSPGREVDVYLLVEELFDYQMPELDDHERVEFLHAFLGLFREVEKASPPSPVTLSPAGPVHSLDGVEDLLIRRLDEVEFGFLDGVWQEDDELPLSGPQAALLTALEETARTYEVRLYQIHDNEHSAPARPVTEWLREIAEIDRAVETAIMSVVEAFRADRSAGHPLMKRAHVLIDELDTSGELPRETIRQCIARRDEMVPIFLNILRDHAHGPGVDDEREHALLLIVHILGELGEQRAFAPLTDMLAREPEWIDEVFGDALTETLAHILISVFDSDSGPLYGLMNNPDANDYVRFSAFEAWTYHVAAGRIDRAEAERYLSSAFEWLQPRGEHVVWVAWLEAIGHLGFTDLRATVRDAFDKGRVSHTSIGFDEFEEILDGASRADDLLAFLAEDRIAPFSDTIGVLSTWHCFSEEYIRENAGAGREPVPSLPPVQPIHTATNPLRSVGRNDPCPCGSGKKFKKCCLQ